MKKVIKKALLASAVVVSTSPFAAFAQDVIIIIILK